MNSSHLNAVKLPLPLSVNMKIQKLRCISLVPYNVISRAFKSQLFGLPHVDLSKGQNRSCLGPALTALVSNHFFHWGMSNRHLKELPVGSTFYKLALKKKDFEFVSCTSSPNQSSHASTLFSTRILSQLTTVESL